jgi:class 3 adenylate cyclase/predicted ATPase
MRERTHSRASSRRRTSLRRLRAVALPQTLPPREVGGHSDVLRGERRQVTVLFCDLVGSTELAQKLDPEELCQVMREYQATCVKAITPFGGYLAQTLGDGLLFYFGFPTAHEDDAVRAVRAGLAAVAAVADHREPLPACGVRCAARAGIYTGTVFAGAVGRHDTRVEHALIGDVPNIAARLQSMAGPSEVLLGPATRKLVCGHFRIDALGPRTLKGLPVPLEVFRACSTTEATRFEGQSKGTLAPLVGRDLEFAELRSRWMQAQVGKGQAVVLSGAAGIGKSRLADALRASAARDAIVFVFQCSPYFQNTALYPLIAQLRRAAAIRRRDTDDLKLTKLRRLLRDDSPDASRNLALLARLLQIPCALAPELAELSGERLLDDTMQLLLERSITLSRGRPVLALIEDAHWSDPLTRGLIAATTRALGDARVMLLITDRGAFADTAGLKGAHAIRLRTLQTDEARAIVGHWAPGGLRRRVVDEIVARSEGIPFFVEELTKAALETPDARTPPVVPASLKDSLMARIDSLGPSKLIAQRASCIGAQFSYEMLELVAGLDPEILARGLQELLDAELISPIGDVSDARFVFRHILLLEAAYESLLLQERRAVHLVIARKLERDYRERLEQEPEALARHFAAAGEARTAFRYWMRAGEMAQARTAHADAIAHLTQALGALGKLLRTREEDAMEAQLQAMLARSRVAAEGWGGLRVYAAYTRALELCRSLGDRAGESEVLWGLCINQCVRGDMTEAAKLAGEYVDISERNEDRTALQMAHNAALIVSFCRADHEQAELHAQRVRGYYRAQDSENWLRVSSHEPLALACTYDSVRLWVQGYPDRGSRVAELGLARARELRHPFQLCHSLLNGSLIYVLRRDYARARAHVDEALALADQLRMLLFTAYGPLMNAPALMERAPTQATLNWLEHCAARVRAGGVQIHVPIYMCHLARAYLRMGQLDDALSRVQSGLEVMAATGERWFEPELLRVKASVELRLRPSSEDGETTLWTAFQSARAAKSRGFELRVVCDLGAHLGPLGRRSEVEELVASALASFDEGFDTADLKRARSWLQHRS